MRIELLILSAVAFYPVFASAGEFRAKEVMTLDNTLKCNSYADWWITTVTGPCTDFIAPKKIAVGQTFSERGVVHTISIIVATQMDKDFTTYGMNLKRGDWYCSAAESSGDLDMNGSQSRRTWLYIPHCKPVR